MHSSLAVTERDLSRLGLIEQTPEVDVISEQNFPLDVRNFLGLIGFDPAEPKKAIQIKARPHSSMDRAPVF